MKRILGIALVVLAACGQAKAPETAAPAVAPVEKEWRSSFDVDTTKLEISGRNPFFVLEPGHRVVLGGKEGSDEVRVEITVLEDTELVDGVVTRVIEEKESKNGELVEISRNFFAIDPGSKDVFYFGEDVDIYKNDTVISHGGAWRSGSGGAKFGLIMPGSPTKGDRYYQEYAPGEALDRAENVSLEEKVQTQAGAFENCLRVEETTPLEPDDLSVKIYAKDVGMIADGSLRLVERSADQP